MGNGAERIAEIEARHARTSGSEWKLAESPYDKGDIEKYGLYVHVPFWGAVAICPRESPQFSAHEGNMAFIANARQDIPWLIAELRSALARIKELEERLGK